MVGFANAKINIGLHVLSQRSDGYHEIETVFYPLMGLRDVVEIVQSSSTDIVSTGLTMDVPLEKNLIFWAYQMLREDFGLGEVMFYLHKVIPMGAGLGGGSADAAVILELLNKQFNLGLSRESLQRYASRLGADCSFFVYNVPMLASGIGEILKPVDLDLDQFNIVVVKPRFSISTAHAYSLVRSREHEITLSQLISLPVEEWRDSIVNDFEQALFPVYPQLKSLKQRLYDLGAIYVSLSGSGSAIYGIFEEKIELGDLDRDYEFVWQSKK